MTYPMIDRDAIGHTELWSPGFIPAIRGAERSTAWYVVKYVSGHEAAMLRVFKSLKLDYRLFTYQFRLNRTRHRKGRFTTRCWLPGYFFVDFDVERDLWQQIFHVPYILEVLGEPTPLPLISSKKHGSSMLDLMARLPENPEKPHAETSIKAGTVVRIDAGIYSKFSGPVIKSDRKYVMLMPMIFGRPTPVQISVRDITVIG